jgi:hypothetical protein
VKVDGLHLSYYASVKFCANWERGRDREVAITLRSLPLCTKQGVSQRICKTYFPTEQTSSPANIMMSLLYFDNVKFIIQHEWHLHRWPYDQTL